jgi:hypothetical protein
VPRSYSGSVMAARSLTSRPAEFKYPTPDWLGHIDVGQWAVDRFSSKSSPPKSDVVGPSASIRCLT